RRPLPRCLPIADLLTLFIDSSPERGTVLLHRGPSLAERLIVPLLSALTSLGNVLGVGVPALENVRLLALAISGVRTKASPRGTGSLRMSEASTPVPQGGSPGDMAPRAACPGRRSALPEPALGPLHDGLAGPRRPTGGRPLGTAHRPGRGPARPDAPA